MFGKNKYKYKCCYCNFPSTKKEVVKFKGHYFCVALKVKMKESCYERAINIDKKNPAALTNGKCRHH